MGHLCDGLHRLQPGLGSLIYRGSRNQDRTRDCMATWLWGRSKEAESKKETKVPVLKECFPSKGEHVW